MVTRPTTDGLETYGYAEGETYFDTAEFIAYKALVEMIIHGAEPFVDKRTGIHTNGSLNTRQITEALGDDARDRWTADAIEQLDSIEAVGILPTRYRRRIGARPMYEKFSGTKSFQRIFPNRSKRSADTPVRNDGHAVVLDMTHNNQQIQPIDLGVKP